MNSLSTEKEYKKYISDMDKYIHDFKNLEPEEAEKSARESLIKSGLLNADGTQKKKICE